MYMRASQLFDLPWLANPYGLLKHIILSTKKQIHMLHLLKQY